MATVLEIAGTLPPNGLKVLSHPSSQEPNKMPVREVISGNTSQEFLDTPFQFLFLVFEPTHLSVSSKFIPEVSPLAKQAWFCPPALVASYA